MQKDSICDIAVIGMSVKFPFCSSLDEYWNIINHGINCVSRFPKQRQIQVSSYAQKMMENDDIKFYDGAYLSFIDEFDNEYFKIPPKDASLMDPVQRMYMQVIVSAIEDAGYSMDALRGKKIGSFVGYTACSFKDNYLFQIYEENRDLVPYSIIGNTAALIPSRIAQLYDFGGPVMVLDTACSSSLVAVHQACQSIFEQSSELALASGIKISLLPINNPMFKLGIESSDGLTRTFDARADGSGIGEGIGTVLLKPLSKAMKDKDRIYAVIKGSAINHDGTSIGLTAPNPASQCDVIERAWRMAGIDVNELSYIEMHGTATSLGDPIEFQGLNKAFAKFTDRKQFCAAGALKTNFGHLFEAAGIASFIKTVLAVSRGRIPASLNFLQPNNKINAINSAMYVSVENRPWEKPAPQRIAGVSAFGLSGTNCHVVLTGYEAAVKEEPLQQGVNETAQREELFCFSAVSKGQLIEYLNQYQKFLPTLPYQISVSRLSYCINQRNSLLAVRICIQAASLTVLMDKIAESIKKLNKFSECKDKPVEIAPGITLFIGKPNYRKAAKKEYGPIALSQVKDDFLSGELICWEDCYDQTYQKIDLPAFPFAKKHFWFEKVCEDGKAFYEKVWVKASERKQTKTYHHILIYDACHGVGEELLRMASGDHLAARLVESYEMVMDSLIEDKTYDLIIYCLDRYENHSLQEDHIYEDVDHVFMIQKMLSYEETVDVTVIGCQGYSVNGLESFLRPDHAMLYGFVRCVSKENSNINTMCIDLDSTASLELTYHEIKCGCGNQLIAIRNNETYQLRLQKSAITSRDNEYQLDKKGVYVITGGAGGAGYEIAKSLCQMSDEIRVILLGRSGTNKKEFSEEQRVRIDQLKALGSKVEYVPCDITKEEMVLETFSYLYLKYGKITGIFHAAGLAGGRGITELNRKIMHEVMDPKVKGTLLIDKYTTNHGIEFLILFSSIATVFPSYGLADYTAASAFMDSYAKYYNSSHTGFCTAINWSTWAETGMSQKSGFTIDTLFKSIQSESAVRLLQYVIQKKADNIIIGELNLDSPIALTLNRYEYLYSDEITDQLNQLRNKSMPQKPADSVLSVEVNREKHLTRNDSLSGNLYGSIEKQVIAICYELLGYENIDINQNFFELGADSITLGHMHTKLDAIYPGMIKITDLLTNPSVHLIAVYLEEKINEDEPLKEKLLGELPAQPAVTTWMNEPVPEKEQATQDGVAVIGIGLHFPCAANAEEYWNVLENGIDTVKSVSWHRKNLTAESDWRFQKKDQQEYRKASYIDDIEMFDYSLFGISPKDALRMDPASRLFLQCCWTALEDAGYGSDALNDSDTGVFMGYSANIANLYSRILYEHDVELFGDSLAVNQISMMPSRISYIKNLHGPCMVIDSACSSSLVSVETACENIKSGRCKVALAGGASLMLMPYEAGMGVGYESPDGRTRAFAQNSNGSATGEGVAVVVLKRLQDAISDRDSIYAIIKGGAVNQDGSSNGIAAPNQKAQTQVIQKAWADAKIDPEKLSYIETHGTGTFLGDTIEIAGIDQAFASFTKKKQFCAFGSVKTNLGHLNEASGMTGLIKLILMMKHHMMVPTIHNTYPNTAIDWMNSSVYLLDQKLSWNCEGKLLAGISGFGMSGTNCHLVLEEADQGDITQRMDGSKQKDSHVLQQNSHPSQNNSYLCVFSAKDKDSLIALLKRWESYLITSKDSIASVSYTLCCGRKHLEYRTGCIVQSVNELEETVTRMRLRIVQSADKETFDALGVADQKKLYYGYYHMIPEQKKHRMTGDITASEKQVRDEEIGRRINEGNKEESQRRISNNNGLWDAILSEYVAGIDIPWNRLFFYNPGFAHLPTYPFTKHPVWIMHKEMEQGYFHTKHWIQRTREDKNPVKGVIAILYRENAVRNEVFEQIPANVDMIQVIIRETAADAFTKVSDNKYEIVPDKKSLNCLFDQLMKVHVKKVIYVAYDQDNQFDAKKIDDYYESCFYLPIHIVKGIVNAHIDWTIDFTIVTSNYSDISKQTCPQYALAVGIARVIEQEFPKLNMSILDVEDALISETAVEDLCCYIDKDLVAAIRNQSRFVEEITDVSLEDTKQYQFTKNGVYLIVGGTSGMGLEIAGHLMNIGCENLILMSRKNPLLYEDTLQSEEDELKERIAKMQELSRHVKHLSILECDASDYDMVCSQIANVHKEYGRITGIFYCAGVTNAGYILRKDESRFRDVLDVKVKGCDYIDRCTRIDQPDFMLLCSSAMSYIGEAGQGDYVAANTYLDAFCEYRNQRGYHTYCINWVSWKETGMSVRHGINFDDITKVLPTKLAIEKMCIVLANKPGRTMIGQYNLEGDHLSMLLNSRCRISKELQKEAGLKENDQSTDALPVNKLVIMPHRKEEITNKTDRQASATEAMKSRKIAETAAIVIEGKKEDEITPIERDIASVYCKYLGYTKIDLYDNFFEMGGDSILIVKVYQDIDVMYPNLIQSTDLFEYTTIESLAAYIEQKKPDTEAAITVMEPVSETKAYPLSYAQRRIYFENMRYRGKKLYNNPFAFSIDQPVSVSELNSAIQELVMRHEALRTTFNMVDGHIRQVIHDTMEFAITVVEKTEDEDLSDFDALMKPFDLKTGPLFFVTYVKLKNKNLILFDVHHIIVDGYSSSLIVKELAQLIQGIPFAESGYRYLDYLTEENRYCESESYLKDQAFWTEELNAMKYQKLTDPDYRAPKKEEKYEGIYHPISNELEESLSEYSKAHGITLFTVFFGALYQALYQLTGSHEFTIGVAVLGRTSSSLQSVIGNFVNMLPVYVETKNDMDSDQYYTELFTRLGLIFKHQRFPYNEIASIAGKLHGVSKLYDVMFEYENTSMSLLDYQKMQQELGSRSYCIPQSGNRSDIDIKINKHNGELILCLNYDPLQYRREFMEDFRVNYQEVLEQIAAKD